jgi:hypothetical protein
VTRVIPGDHQATIEWLRPAKVADVSRLRYRVSLKFRSAPWEDAQVLDLPGDRTSATIDDLLNGADYSVRVVAEEAGSPKPVAINEERLVTPGYVPGVVIDYLHREDPVYEQKGQYVGSPSLARLDDGRLVASHDLFGPGSSDFTRVFISADGGRTWRHASDVQPAFWGKLFTHRGKLYLLACSKPSGDLLLHPSPDGGATWGKPVVLARGKFHKAPVPVVEHGGRLWTCVEGSGASWAAGFGAVALSAPADADLLDPKSWTVSEPRPYDPAWLPKSCKLAEKKHGFLEGNAVMDPEGHLLNVLRYHISPCFGKAVVLRIAEDGKSLSFDRIMEMPGGQCKFTIHRHPETGLYWSLVNHITNPEQPGMRNVLTLISSPDLNHWTLVRDILRDDADTAPRTTGFQYADWLFDRRDIIFVSRTACNGAHSFHDANHLTFHRIPDFAAGPRWVGP